jgi:muconolactone delta-isomerase
MRARVASGKLAASSNPEVQMRFLVTTASKFPAPPEQVPGILAAERQWRDRYAEQLQEYGSFIGPAGGYGIVEVDDAGKLSEMVASHPLSPYCETEVRLITDFDTVARNVAAAIEQALRHASPLASA